MKRFFPVLLALVVITQIQSASAGCRTTPIRFNFDANSETTSEGVVTEDGFCRLTFWTTAGSFTESDILKKPHNGTLKQINVSTFAYQAKSNFKGKDDFTFKLCGVKRIGGGGCVTAAFAMTIE